MSKGPTRSHGGQGKIADGTRPVAQNKRARHDYDILDTFECGMVLAGAEVKSLREGKVQLRESFARVMVNEVWLFGVHISPWTYANGFGQVNPDRQRKLLLNRHEIEDLKEAVGQDGLTLVPLSIYFKEGRAKLELAVARGRKNQDRRHAIAERDQARDAARAVRSRERD